MGNIIITVMEYIGTVAFAVSGAMIAAILFSLPLTVIIRLLAAKYHWKLPKINFESKKL